MRRSVVTITLIVSLVFALPILFPSDPMLTDILIQMQPPSQAHLLGTDFLGRDILSRILYGGQRTLIIAGLATLTALLPGILIGLLAGWLRGRFETLILIIFNALLALPNLLLALVILTLLGRGTLPLIVATGFTQIVPYAMTIRGAVLGIRTMSYIEAAYAAGAHPTRVLLHHIFPNVQATALGYGGIVFSYNIINSAALSFLGLGGEPGIPDWGTMLADARLTFRVAPWMALIPGLAITMTVLAVNNLVDKLVTRDAKRHL